MYAQLLVLANSAQKLLLDPIPIPRTIHYRGLLHDSSPVCSLCASCWGTSGGWRRMYVAFTYLHVFLTHTKALSLLLAFVCEDCISFIFVRNIHVAGVFTF